MTRFEISQRKDISDASWFALYAMTEVSDPALPRLSRETRREIAVFLLPSKVVQTGRVSSDYVAELAGALAGRAYWFADETKHLMVSRLLLREASKMNQVLELQTALAAE